MKPPLLPWIVAVLALLAGAAIWLSFQYDKPVRDALVQAQGKSWKESDDYKFYGAVREYGDWPEIMMAGAVGLLVAWKLRSREWTRILAAAMIASTLAGIVANASRLTTGRTRPRESPKIEQGFFGPWHDGRLLIGRPAYNSFPSGHTATAFGFAAVFVFASPWIGVGVIIVAGLIGWASITMGAHHPSDVVVSIVLSFVVAWFVWGWVRRRGDRAIYVTRAFLERQAKKFRR